ncbi:glutathione ABC transporter substrate-binding protein [Maledivibacter halophilus]|uniref:Peptide/nickel transport system substrate-binding protein n=1 Tax=Maledivibacter halophilus TaxID=36842 RepID=A0A1T5MQL9_9FIRM|nr:glutathione ABC transporter substrate-binding protein [Maledivibacter halophilus]SKC90188.1 peptide/nickel transport system substrate-binding protein [Maledivibacter halophilus]
MFNKKIKKILLLIMIMTLGFAIMTGCGGSKSAAKEGEEKNTLIVGLAAEPKGIDPHPVNDVPSGNALVQIYETLITQDVDMNIQPLLAETWKQIDDLTWEFKLKKGVKFHNGEELKASDVKFSFQRACESARIGHIVGMIDADNIEIIDDYTVRIPTKEPFSALLPSLCHTGGMILSEKAVNEAGEAYGEKPVGTGPFKFVEWKRGDSLIFERFDDYHGEKAKIKKLVMRVIPERTNRVIELETGGIDVCYDIGANDITRLEENEDIEVYRKISFSTGYLGMNCLDDKFKDARVRQAVNYALDVDAMVNSVLKGVGTVAKGPLTPNVPGANLELKPYGHDIEKAKQLLKEAGFENGLKTELWTNENKDRINMAEIIQAQLKEVGIDVEVKILEWGAMLEGLNNKEHEMLILGWNNSTGDPDIGLYAPFHSSKHGKGGNRVCYTNKRVDELLDLGRKTFDTEKRNEIYYEVQEIIYNEAAWGLLYNKEVVLGAKKNLKGLKVWPNNKHRFDFVYFGE